MTTLDRERLKTLVGPLVVVAVAAVAAFSGAGIRDMTGDEHGGLCHTLYECWDRTLELDRPESYSGHMPLSWLIRMGWFRLIGVPSEPWQWRVHVALAAVAAAWATWWCLAREDRRDLGLAAGLAVAINPLLAFHSHDSMNYALTPLPVAVTVAGLCDVWRGRRRGIAVLSAGLLLGISNDFHFFPIAGVALAGTVIAALRSDRRRRSAAVGLIAWGVVALALAWPATVAVQRARSVSVDTGALTRRHLGDVGEARPYDQHLEELISVPSAVLFEGYEGFDDARFVEPYVHPPWRTLMLVAGLLGLLSRVRPVAASGLLVLGTLGGMSVVSFWFEHTFGNSYPLVGRFYIGLVPTASIIATSALMSLGRRAGPPAVAVLLIALAVPTARIALNPSRTHAGTARTIESLWEPGDRLITTSSVDLRLRIHGPASDVMTRDGCLSRTDGLPDRLWLADVPGGELSWRNASWCDDRSPVGLPQLDYRTRLVQERFVPLHELDSNSYLQAAHLQLVERGAATSPRGPMTLTVRRRLFDGATRVRWRWFPDLDSDAVGEGEAEIAASVPLGVPPEDAAYLDLHVSDRALPGWMPEWLSKGWSDFAFVYSRIELPSDPIIGELPIELDALGNPWIFVLHQVARGISLALVLLAVPLVPWRWWQRRRRERAGTRSASCAGGNEGALCGATD